MFRPLLSFFLGVFFVHISSFSYSLILAFNYSEYDSLKSFEKYIKYEGRSESNATRFLFMTLSLKGTQIVHHKKVYGMSIL